MELNGEMELNLNPSPSHLIIEDQGNGLINIDLTTGEITFGAGYTPEGAAKVFWDGVARVFDQRMRFVEDDCCWSCGQRLPE